MKMRDELPIRTLIRPDTELNIILKDLTELDYSIVILTNTGKYLVYEILEGAKMGKCLGRYEKKKIISIN